MRRLVRRLVQKLRLTLEGCATTIGSGLSRDGSDGAGVRLGAAITESLIARCRDIGEPSWRALCDGLVGLPLCGRDSETGLWGAGFVCITAGEP